ncbi:PQQ-dependent sugar dehydrogenase [Haloparvum alkalitolerans]|uniref:PQQ-dependent sugar dehydrogenase n=1 Tax=Haloparvum alkalitolerans TaxID=1042953 RepID=UPI003CED912A
MDTSRRRFLAATGLVGLPAAGCLDDGAGVAPIDDEPSYDRAVTHDGEAWTRYDLDWEPPTAPPDLDVTVETVVEDLEIPWDLAFAPDGDLFVSERTGRIARYSADDLETVASADVLSRADAVAPGEEGGWWDAGGEGGLLGIAVHPNYPDVPLVYAFYTRETDDGVANRLSHFDVEAPDPTATETVLIDDIPADDAVHNGARLAFGPASYLWVTTGDAGDRGLAADPDSLAGSVLRLEPDGSAPADNPAIEGGDPRVFTYGHRNPQGITFLPDATPVITEHGPGSRDEVNVLRPGADHGWGPEEGGSFARDGDTYPETDYARPVVNTGPSETWAPPGCVFYTGDAVPSWRNRLVVGGLSSQRINLVTVYSAGAETPPTATADGGTEGVRYDADWMDGDYDAVAHRALADELGRIRHVEQGPDGALYAITSNRDGRAHQDRFPRPGDDRLVRIGPD